MTTLSQPDASQQTGLPATGLLGGKSPAEAGARAVAAQKIKDRDLHKTRLADRFFAALTTTAGASIMVVLGFVAVFLVARSLPALLNSETSFFSYVWPLMAGTVMASAMALVLAVPVAIGVALFISHYAPRKLAAPIGYVIDLLAAIPSVVYGAWGMAVLAPLMVPAYEWLNAHLGFIPLFAADPTVTTTGRTLMTSAVVLAVMILPIITAMSRELFVQTPALHQEAALALGATRWEMIRATVFPFAAQAMVSAVLLGLGRALGETMAVTMVLSPGAFSFSAITSGANNTIPAEIALNFPEAFGMRQSELIAAGLMLFIITLLVNTAARAILARSKKKAEG